jgi:hypothetical protein
LRGVSPGSGGALSRASLTVRFAVLPVGDATFVIETVSMGAAAHRGRLGCVSVEPNGGFAMTAVRDPLRAGAALGAYPFHSGAAPVNLLGGELSFKPTSNLLGDQKCSMRI